MSGRLHLLESAQNLREISASREHRESGEMAADSSCFVNPENGCAVEMRVEGYPQGIYLDVDLNPASRLAYQDDLRASFFRKGYFGKADLRFNRLSGLGFRLESADIRDGDDWKILPNSARVCHTVVELEPSHFPHIDCDYVLGMVCPEINAGGQHTSFHDWITLLCGNDPYSIKLREEIGMFLRQIFSRVASTHTDSRTADLTRLRFTLALEASGMPLTPAEEADYTRILNDRDTLRAMDRYTRQVVQDYLRWGWISVTDEVATEFGDEEGVVVGGPESTQFPPVPEEKIQLARDLWKKLKSTSVFTQRAEFDGIVQHLLALGDEFPEDQRLELQAGDLGLEDQGLRLVQSENPLWMLMGYCLPRTHDDVNDAGRRFPWVCQNISTIFEFMSKITTETDIRRMLSEGIGISSLCESTSLSESICIPGTAYFTGSILAYWHEILTERPLEYVAMLKAQAGAQEQQWEGPGHRFKVELWLLNYLSSSDFISLIDLYPDIRLNKALWYGLCEAFPTAIRGLYSVFSTWYIHTDAASCPGFAAGWDEVVGADSHPDRSAASLSVGILPEDLLSAISLSRSKGLPAAAVELMRAFRLKDEEKIRHWLQLVNDTYLVPHGWGAVYDQGRLIPVRILEKERVPVASTGPAAGVFATVHQVEIVRELLPYTDDMNDKMLIAHVHHSNVLDLENGDVSFAGPVIDREYITYSEKTVIKYRQDFPEMAQTLGAQDCNPGVIRRSLEQSTRAHELGHIEELVRLRQAGFADSVSAETFATLKGVAAADEPKVVLLSLASKVFGRDDAGRFGLKLAADGVNYQAQTRHGLGAAYFFLEMARLLNLITDQDTLVTLARKDRARIDQILRQVCSAIAGKSSSELQSLAHCFAEEYLNSWV